MNKKKIAVIYSGAKNFGGIETYILSLFKNYDQKEIDLKLLSLGNWELADRLTETQKVIFSEKRFRPQTAFEMSKYLKENNFSLLVTHGNVSTAYGRLASLLSGIPNLTTIHSDPYFDYHNPLIRIIYRFLDRISSFQTNKYIAVSNYLKKLMANQGVNSRKIKVIYNGTVIPEIDAKKPDKEIIIGSAGRLHLVKNFHKLIQAIALLGDANIRLKIAGQGQERENLELLIAKLDLKNRVELVGFQENIFNFLEEIDIYVQPSEAEGFGLLVVEAMGAGLPVIVSPKGSLPEIVKDGENGIIAKSTDPQALAAAINLLLENKKLQKELSEKAKKYVANEFSIEKWQKETIETYLGAAK